MQTNSLGSPLEWKSRLENYFEDHGPSFLTALVILIVGIFVARWLGRAARRWLGRSELQLEPPIQMLGARLIRLLVFIFALLIAADTAGIHVTALLTGLGVIGVGVGLAMQSVLSNLMAGLNLIFTRPFRVGEYVELLGVQGRVLSIELFSTTLLNNDRSEIIIPNHKIVGEILRNYGQIRQLGLNVGVAYGTDLNVVLATVRGVLERNPRQASASACWRTRPSMSPSARGRRWLIMARRRRKFIWRWSNRFARRTSTFPFRSVKCGCSKGIDQITLLGRPCSLWRAVSAKALSADLCGLCQ